MAKQTPKRLLSLLSFGGISQVLSLTLMFSVVHDSQASGMRRSKSAVSKAPQTQGTSDMTKTQPAPDHVPGQLLVSFKPNTSQEKRREIFTKLGITEKSKVGSTELYLVEVPSTSSLDSMIETLQSFTEIRFAEKNMTLKTFKPLDGKLPTE
jgi:hypothetical protein